MAVALFLILMAALPAGMPTLSVLGLSALMTRPWPRMAGLVLVMALLMLVLLSLLAVNATAKGAAQLVICLFTMGCFMQLARLQFLDRQAAGFAATAAAAMLIATPLTIVLTSVPDWMSLMLVPGDHGGIRFRFVFAEPNPLAFMYFFSVLRFSDSLWAKQGPVKWLCFAGALVAPIAIGSPLAYVGLMFVSLDLILRLQMRERLLVLLPLAAFVSLLIVSPPASIERRVDLLVSGEDNSLNLRTWGALAIAEATLEESGTLVGGAGIGRSRDVLDENPLMSLFAAQEESTLPSLAATTLVETGYIGVVCVFGLLLLGITGARRSLSGVLSGLFLTLHAASGSYFYDTLFWASLGAQLGCGKVAPRLAKRTA